jgi:hypothetical protein
MTDKHERWLAFMRETLAEDPEWRRIYRDLKPNMPLRDAVEVYLGHLRSQVAPTPAEARRADRLLAALQARGLETPDQVLDGVEQSLRRARRPASPNRDGRGHQRSQRQPEQAHTTR